MSGRMLLLSGPPASGKDTITTILGSLDARYKAFPKLKVGSGRTTGYRVATRERLEELDRVGAIVQRHARYGNIYAVDRPTLERMVADGLRPIIHVGRIENLRVLRASGFEALSVLLWADRVTTEQRLRGRGSADVDHRLVAWAEERGDLEQPSIAPLFDLALRTDRHEPMAVAQAIDAAFRAHAPDPGAVKTALAELLAS